MGFPFVLIQQHVGISYRKSDFNGSGWDVMGCWTEAPPARGACYVQQEREKLIEGQQHNGERQERPHRIGVHSRI